MFSRILSCGALLFCIIIFLFLQYSLNNSIFNSPGYGISFPSTLFSFNTSHLLYKNTRSVYHFNYSLEMPKTTSKPTKAQVMHKKFVENAMKVPPLQKDIIAIMKNPNISKELKVSLLKRKVKMYKQHNVSKLNEKFVMSSQIASNYSLQNTMATPVKSTEQPTTPQPLPLKSCPPIPLQLSKSFT